MDAEGFAQENSMHIIDRNHSFTISRRNFLRSGALAAAAVPAISATGVAEPTADASTKPASQHAFEPTPDFLKSAEGAAQWIETARKQDERGAYWLPEPDHPEKTTTVSAVNAVYSGSAGTVLFFIQLANATGESRYLQTAASGADYLAATWRDLVDKPGEGLLSSLGLNLSFYGGLSGVAFVLNEAGKATGNGRYREAAKAATDYIVQTAKPAGAGDAWSGAPGIAADGSIVLYLLHAAREFNNQQYSATAQRAGDRILELATNERKGGFSWRGFPPFPGLPKDAYFPNFEGGTAGVAYMFARLYAETNKAKYLFAAKQGALHLQSIATLHGNAALIPYRLPDLPDLYYLGFCHGPAGSARTFFELHRITREPEYQLWTERLAQGVLQSGIPESLTPGYWNVVCQCCGSAAVIELFVGLWASTGRADYLAFAQRVARQLVSRETNLDGKGSRWYQAWTRVKPWEVSAETGYSIGASGVGAALLHVHLAERGKYSVIRFPDNPFSSTRNA
jgi:lantibiotic modifying enzyme